MGTGVIAKFSGTALRPGVSRNRRLYTPEAIKKAAARAQERLADPNGLPIPMRTHHDAGDDTGRIVGRITGVSVDEDNALRYTAELFDTAHGRDVMALTRTRSPALRSVSIHGYWLGSTKQVQTAEGLADTADDLEIDAIDFTAFPGVVGALIDAPGGPAAESHADGLIRTAISESAEAQVVIVEESSGWAEVTNETKKGDAMPEKFSAQRGRQYELDPVTPARWWISEAKYSADDMRSLLSKGHAMKNASGEPSYPIADVSDLKKAIRAVGRGKGSHDAIRKHIIKRAKALGQAGLIPDNWNSDGTMKESAPIRMSEIREYYPDGPDGMAGFCIDAYAGPLSVTVRGCVAPDELRFAAQLATKAAMDAIRVMDPDADGDMLDADDVDDNGNIIPDNEESDDVVLPDDDMNGNGESVTVNVAGSVLTAETLRAEVTRQIEELRRQFSGMSMNDYRREVGLPPLGADGVPLEEMTMHPDDHSHAHEMDGSTHTHAHMHDHPAEGGAAGYSHGHTHTHVHASTDGPQHDHGHGHIHTTSSSATAETTEQSEQVEESAMGDVQNAAEAAPTRTLTEADMTALGTTIGNSLAEALRAFAEQNTPKHAAPAEVTAESAATTQAVEEKSEKTAEVDVATLKESIAAELRKELRDELRAQILEEKGLPPRRGYRIGESDEEVQATDSELYDNRVDLLLGAYAKAPNLNDAPSA